MATNWRGRCLVTQTAHRRRIILTALVQQKDHFAGLAAGADRYLMKPGHPKSGVGNPPRMHRAKQIGLGALTRCRKKSFPRIITRRSGNHGIWLASVSPPFYRRVGRLSNLRASAAQWMLGVMLPLAAVLFWVDECGFDGAHLPGQCNLMTYWVLYGGFLLMALGFTLGVVAIRRGQVAAWPRWR